MLILAVECSTKIASLAILHHKKLVAFEKYEVPVGKSINLPLAVKEILANNTVLPCEIELYALSIGPGSYSGLRAAIATVSGLALPAKTPIFSIPTPDVIAYQYLQKHSCNSPLEFIVIGDARRMQFWYRSYRNENGIPIPISDIGLLKYSECLNVIHSHLVSSEKEKIVDLFKPYLLSSYTLKAESEYPLAATVAIIAENCYKKEVSTQESNVVLPIYMHPAI